MEMNMVSKIDRIRKMIGEYFDYDGDTYHYFMSEIDEIEGKERNYLFEEKQENEKKEH